LTWVNHRGEEVESLPLPAQAYVDPSISPDGRRIAFTKFDKGTFNIWVRDLPNGAPTQLTFEYANFFPIWTPDSMSLTFTSFRPEPFNLYSIPINRSSREEPLLLRGPDDQAGTSWSSDGILLLNELNANTGWDISSFSVEDGNTSRPLICESGRQVNAIFSPDENWIAYESSQEGRTEIYVSPYPKIVPKKISTDGGYHPIWSEDGRQLFYRNADRMVAATIETEPEVEVSKFEVLFEGQYYTGMYRSYGVSHDDDGPRFLMIKESEGRPAASQLIVKLNWFEELKRLVPTGSD